MTSEYSSAAPAGYTTVAPWVVTDDTGGFLDFVTRAFGGVELGRVTTEDGLIGHGEIGSGTPSSSPSTGTPTGRRCRACCVSSSPTPTRR